MKPRWYFLGAILAGYVGCAAVELSRLFERPLTIGPLTHEERVWLAHNVPDRRNWPVWSFGVVLILTALVLVLAAFARMHQMRVTSQNA